MHARRLFPDHDPFRRVGRRADVRTARDLLGGHPRRADSVREPAGIGHLVNRVDVLSARPEGVWPETHEQVVHLFVQLLDRIGLGVRRVLRLWFAGNRIVVIEARRLGRRHDGEQAQRDGAQRREPNGRDGEASGECRCLHRRWPQKAEEVATTRTSPSLPLANSRRSGVDNGPWNRSPKP